MKKLPKFLKKYFWDVDFKNYNLEEYKGEVIFRILEMGDERAITWLKRNFPKEQIVETLSRRRGFSKKSVVFWSEIFKVPQQEILCLKKPYQKIKDRLWPY